MKKNMFRITDEDGNKYEVEEIVEQKETMDDDENISELTSEEIIALKRLASIADKLANLVKETTDEEEVVEETNEEIIDTDEEEVEIRKTCDSRRSVGAIDKKYKANDSIDVQDEIADAWNKRLNGGNR